MNGYGAPPPAPHGYTYAPPPQQNGFYQGPPPAAGNMGYPYPTAAAGTEFSSVVRSVDKIILTWGPLTTFFSFTSTFMLSKYDIEKNQYIHDMHKLS